MARQYQLPGGPYVNVGGNGLEYQLPGGPYINEEAAGGGSTTPRTGLSGIEGGIAGRMAGLHPIENGGI